MRTLRATCFGLVAAALLAGVFAAPAVAQFERQIPTTEDDDTIDLASGQDPGSWWLAETDGDVVTGPAGGATCDPGDVEPGYVTGIDSTPSGEGYWTVTTYGRVSVCGDAPWLGSLPFVPNAPVVGIAATPSGQGYWLAAADGGVFSFGDAQFRGSAGGIQLNAPVVGIDAASDAGYWLTAIDGGVFSFGDAAFHGSAGGIDLHRPVVDIAATPGGGGYYLVGEDGGVFTYGDAVYRGSRWDRGDADRWTDPFVAIDVVGAGNAYQLTDSHGNVLTIPPTDTPGFSQALLTDVRVGTHDGFDRVTFEFREQGPEPEADFVEPPILEDFSGREVEVQGDAFLKVYMRDAAGFDPVTGEPVYEGPLRITPEHPAIRELVRTGDFEGVITWVIGLDERVEPTLLELDDPPRLVVDVPH